MSTLGKKRSYTPASKKASKFKKAYKKQQIGTYNNNRVHVVKRHVDFFSVPLVGATATTQGFNFSLNDVPSSTDFTNLYDQYKICAVQLKFFPSQTQSVSLNPLERANANARFLSAIDLNDSTAPLTSDEIRGYETCQVTSILDTHERFIKNPMYQNSTGQNTSDWVATTSPSLNWNGLKVYIEPCNATGTNTTLVYHVEAIYYLCFKNVK
jgi:hypothetical protein